MIDFILYIGSAASFAAALAIFFFARKKILAANDLLGRADEKWRSVKRDIENERREALLKIKDEVYKRRSDFEIEMRRDKLDIERQQSKIASKYEAIEKKEVQLDELKNELQQKERKMSRLSETLHANEEKLKVLYSELITKLENMSGLSKEQAKKELADTLQAEVHLSNQKWIQKIEEEYRQTAKTKAVDITVTAMQRYTHHLDHP